MVFILNRGGENYAVYLVIGLVCWRWINTSIGTSAKAIMKYSSIINQVYLPKSIFPIATTSTQIFNFAFGLIIIFLFLLVFGIVPGWQIIYLPLIIIVQVLFLLAISLFVSYICVFVRDIDNILSHILRIFFYASPVIWEKSMVPAEYGWIYAVNPVAILLDSYRSVLMWNSLPNFIGLFVIAVISICLIAFLIFYYSRNEHKIIKAL